MSQRLHLVFGGELNDVGKVEFADLSQIDIVGLFPDFASARVAWKAAAQRTVDQAQTRYFVAHLHRLIEEEDEASPTEKIG